MFSLDLLRSLVATVLFFVAFSISAGAQCTSTVSSFPYSESFEGSTLWTPALNNSGTSGCNTGGTPTWSMRTGGTGSTGTGPLGAQSGSIYIFTEASGSCSNKTFIIYSPCFNLSGKTSSSVSFYYHMIGAQMGSVFLEASNNNGASWASIWSRSGSQQATQASPWLSSTVNLNAYNGQTVQLRYRGVTGAGWSSDIAIDNISVTATGSGGGGTPDYIVQSQSAPTSATAGTTVNLSCQVRNNGTAAATAGSQLRYYLSTNSTYSSGDTQLGNDAVAALGVGAVNNENVTATIPAATPAGNYYILFRADADGNVSESNEGNNVSFRNITITASGGGGTGGLWTQSGSNIYYNTGNVGIGTTNPGTYKLAVEGRIGAREVKVTPDSWADYVLLPNYQLPELKSIEAFIARNGHLPDIPSEKEVLEEGIDLGEMNKLLLKKIEELTLIIIAQDKRIEAIEKK